MLIPTNDSTHPLHALCVSNVVPKSNKVVANSLAPTLCRLSIRRYVARSVGAAHAMSQRKRCGP